MDTQNYQNEKSAFIAIVGRPNVGKSSILNRLIGNEARDRLEQAPDDAARASWACGPRATHSSCSSTRRALIKPKNSLGDYMVKSVTQSVAGVDACLLVTEAGTKISKADEELAARFRSLGLPAVLAINKIDLLEDKSLLMQQIESLSKLYDFDAVVPVSARDGNGMDALRDELFAPCAAGAATSSRRTRSPTSPSASSRPRSCARRSCALRTRRSRTGVAVVTESMKERRRPARHRRDDLLRARHAQGHPDRQGRRDAQGRSARRRARTWSVSSGAGSTCASGSRSRRTGASAPAC